MKQEAVVEEKGMPKRVKLWNRGQRVFDYKVNGEPVKIDPGACIEIARRRAVEIRGFYPGKDIPVSLEIEPILDEFEEPITTDEQKKYACPYCDEGFEDAGEFKTHLKKHSRGRPKKEE